MILTQNYSNEGMKKMKNLSLKKFGIDYNGSFVR